VLSKCLASEEIFQTLNSEVKQEILEAAAKDITRALGGELNQLGNQEYIINSARFAITVSYVPSVSNFLHQKRSLAFSGQKYFAALAFKLAVHSHRAEILNMTVNLIMPSTCSQFFCICYMLTSLFDGERKIKCKHGPL
jgi:hypothetical protein